MGVNMLLEKQISRDNVLYSNIHYVTSPKLDTNHTNIAILITFLRQKSTNKVYFTFIN